MEPDQNYREAGKLSQLRPLPAYPAYPSLKLPRTVRMLSVPFIPLMVVLWLTLWTPSVLFAWGWKWEDFDGEEYMDAVWYVVGFPIVWANQEERRRKDEFRKEVNRVRRIHRDSYTKTQQLSAGLFL